MGEHELSLFDREFRVLSHLKNGHTNLIKAHHARLLTNDESNLETEAPSGKGSSQTKEASKQLEEPVAYLVLEYCPGDDLFTYVKSGATRLNS